MLKSYHTEFFTAAILPWQKLLQNDQLKQIIIDSLQWLVKKKMFHLRFYYYAQSYPHLLWKMADGMNIELVHGAFLSFTAHSFKKYLKQFNVSLLETYAVDAKDRAYQFWQRNTAEKERLNF